MAIFFFFFLSIHFQDDVMHPNRIKKQYSTCISTNDAVSLFKIPFVFKILSFKITVAVIIILFLFFILEELLINC